MVELILLVLVTYAAAGLIFAVAFVSRGIGRIDPAARGAPWTFRMLMIPGSAALWPMLLARWIRISGGQDGR